MFTYANGDKYEGDFINGCKQGRGKFTWTNGNAYDGNWSNGLMNGNGKVYGTNNELLKELNFENGVILN